MKTNALTMIKKSLLVVSIILVLSTVSFAATDIVNLNQGASYSSTDLNNMSLELAKRYPNLIQYNLIGKSFDDRPIYSLILTSNINDITDLKEETHGVRDHHLIETGIHSREGANPVFALKMIEDYAKRYYSELEKDNSIKKMFNTHVFHFYVLSNPDGFDLSRFGYSSAKSEATKKVLDGISDKNYPRYKANMRGVDVNRNFNTLYLSKETGEWQEFHGTVKSKKGYNPKPGGDFFGGYEPASEIETQLLQNYMLAYDFRNLVSIHSRGQVLYWDKKYMSEDFNGYAEKLGSRYSKTTGYRPWPREYWEGELTGVGYMSDWAASQVNKPLITVETFHWTVPLPAPQNPYTKEYRRVKDIPVSMAKESESTGYFKYRLYDSNGIYVRDFIDEPYAIAHAELINGQVIEGEGVPVYNIKPYFTRKQFLDIVFEKYLEVGMTNDIYFQGQPFNSIISTTTVKPFFNDYNNELTTFGVENELINKAENFNPNRLLSPVEGATFLINFHNWFKPLGRENSIPNKENITDLLELSNQLKPFIDNIPKWGILNSLNTLRFNFLDVNAFSEENKFLNEKYILNFTNY